MSARERALAYNERNVDYLAYRVRALHRLQGVRPVQIKRHILDAGNYSESQQADLDKRWSKWMKGQWRSLKESEYTVIINYLFDNALWMHDRLIATMDLFYPDSVFHSLSQFMLMTPTQVAETSAALSGEYNSYCYIYSVPDHIAVGRLAVRFDPDSRAIVTREDYHLAPPGDPSGLRAGYDGYLTRTARSHRIFARADRERPTGIPAEAQVSVLHGVEYDGGKAREMEGIVLHSHRDEFFYLTRVYFERIGDGIPEETMRIGRAQGTKALRAGDISSRIVGRLKRPLSEVAQNIWRVA
jgi:hypothetical protein